MTEPDSINIETGDIRSALAALSAIAQFYRIPADPQEIVREATISTASIQYVDLIRCANIVGLKAKIVEFQDEGRLKSLPIPSIIKNLKGEYLIFSGFQPNNKIRISDVQTRTFNEYSYQELLEEFEQKLLLINRKILGPGSNPQLFNFKWFLPTIWRYRQPFSHVLVASFFIQIFALVTPLIFQVVIDKVLGHKSYDTLLVLILALLTLGLFDVILQFLRAYALSHTTNRIDVELGRRIFHHLLRLPMSYFETRSAGQTAARVRELETIRSFITGQGIFSLLDIFFAITFVIVLLYYSWKLTLIVVASIPLYFSITLFMRPIIRDKIQDKFYKNAQSQQLLIETIVGAQTIKSAAAEAIMQKEWEDKLSSYVLSAFDAGLFATGGQLLIQYLNKVVTAALLFFGAKAVIEGEMTVGELVAFNMISAQVSQPILRLSQLWQDFQQVQISVERIGDILNTHTEQSNTSSANMDKINGSIQFKGVSFRYQPNMPEVIKNLDLDIRPGEVIGIVGRSGSGKSTLAKLTQRFYIPERGNVFVDGVDVSQINPTWLRSKVGVVLQDNLLFNRTIHENIAFSNPGLSRNAVVQLAEISGAHEFITRLPLGYDTLIEERGANLSGGQRQRLAIARSLSTNPPILIFDEATSALDFESEKIIQDNMKRITANRTVIIIAHRLHAVMDCDRIIALKDGEKIEEGNHSELISIPGGVYAGLWALQNKNA